MTDTGEHSIEPDSIYRARGFERNQSYYESGLRCLARRNVGALIKEIAYEEDLSVGTVRHRMRYAKDVTSLVVTNWGRGCDTTQIAMRLGLSEATVYNLLSRARDGALA
jgi:DNA-binding CsgD family transcriptional regulator